MQRQRLTPNVHVGLALGIATASVILALGGCAITPGKSGATHSADSAPASASLEQFSETERARILAVQDIVAEAAAEHQLDPALLNAMIWVESRFDPKAKSPAGARGLMQLMPATAAYLAKRMGEASARSYDPEFNVRAGALYLAEMQHKFGDEQLAVAAYHAGPGNVKKWVESGQQFPAYSEAYVAKVMDARARFSGVETHGRRSGQRAPIVKSEAKQAPVVAEVDPVDELVPPDLATLPDAAEIHGVDRVIHERPEPQPQPEPRPEPVFEPVFEPHPELDRKPGAPPPGWSVAPVSEPKPRPKPRPRPAPAQEPKPAPEEIGIGVLPDL
ncbi:MAG: lytic transglycosylase domain-containing protein [Enhygromyxa sp.]